MSAHAIITLATRVDAAHFEALKARLRTDGTLWLFAECSSVDAWRMAFALQDAGWILRSDIIWTGFELLASECNVPVRAHQFVFLLSLLPDYYFDTFAIREDEGARNRRSVWNMPAVEAILLAVKAGTSEVGVCSECGVPKVREVETTYRHHEHFFGHKQGARHSRGKAGNSYDEPIAKVTAGWRRGCTHDGAPVPATVIMPSTLRMLAGVETEILGRRIECQ